MKTVTKYQFVLLSLSLMMIVPTETQIIFAEKIVSIQKIVNADKTSLIDSLSNLEKYSEILPDYIQSSKFIDNSTGNMKMGLDWISVDTDVRFTELNDKFVLEAISGDFKGTKLYVTMIEKTNTENIMDKKTNVSADLYLQRSWHMEILTSFVSDDNIKSMLNTSLNGLVEYAKNPQTSVKMTEEKEKLCIFGLCF